MHFEDVVKSFQHLCEWDQVQAVNQFWNNWGVYYPDVKDYWSTPEELLNARSGDCEDFAIAKFLTCRALGIPSERLRLIYTIVRKPMLLDGVEVEAVEGHMLLKYFPKPVLLDIPSMNSEEGEEAYAFDDRNVWLDDEAVADATIIKKWKRVLDVTHWRDV